MFQATKLESWRMSLSSDIELQDLEFVPLGFGLAVVYYFLIILRFPLFGMIAYILTRGYDKEIAFSFKRDF